MMFSRDIWHTFNPHEREARDLFLCRNIKTDSYFNPHEREARDHARVRVIYGTGILISNFSIF